MSHIPGKKQTKGDVILMSILTVIVLSLTAFVMTDQLFLEAVLPLIGCGLMICATYLIYKGYRKRLDDEDAQRLRS